MHIEFELNLETWHWILLGVVGYLIAGILFTTALMKFTRYDPYKYPDSYPPATMCTLFLPISIAVIIVIGIVMILVFVFVYFDNFIGWFSGKKEH